MRDWQKSRPTHNPIAVLSRDFKTGVSIKGAQPLGLTIVVDHKRTAQFFQLIGWTAH